MTLSPPKLPDITSKADLAVFGLGYAAGFALYVVVFRQITPPTSTVALVVAIAALAIKSGIQVWQEREPPAPGPEQEQERQNNLADRFVAFEELFTMEGKWLEAGPYNRIVLNQTLDPESRWEPNLSRYESHTEPLYVLSVVNEALYERVLMLHAIWKAGVVTDAYAETRLDELSDLCSRKGSMNQEASVSPSVAEKRLQEAGKGAGNPYFGAQLKKLRSDKGIKPARLAQRMGISVGKMLDLEEGGIDPKLSTVHEIVNELGVDPSEFFPQRSNG